MKDKHSVLIDLLVKELISAKTESVELQKEVNEYKKDLSRAYESRKEAQNQLNKIKAEVKCY